jgi:protein-S-isoprenylcysteine O-methyltransferase Ste14
MNKSLAFSYGVISYLIFFLSFLYAIGFVGNLVVPKSIDSGAEGPFVVSLVINIILLFIFALQHSVMARPAFKLWWTRYVPEPIERSTYVLLSSLALILLFWLWQPMTGVIWSVENRAGTMILNILFWAGWIFALLSTFMINHFDLFGLRQTYLLLKDREYTSVEFTTPGLYRYIRHPIMTGFIIAFWATPHMTTGHLLFAVVTTLYIVVAVQFEERDLIRSFGDTYKDYRRQVSMLFPLKTKKRG